MGDLQTIGNNALQKAPQPLRRALDGLGVQFRGEGGPTQSIASGSQSGNLAGVLAHDPRTINVMDTGAFQKAPEQLATHEGMHLAQNNWAPAIQSAIPADNPADPYNFGGSEGVKRLLSQGKGIANMPREQAAAAMQYGQSQGMPEPYNQLAHTMDKIPLSTIEMTDPMAKTMNMHPRAPQVPPSSVPGMNFAKEIYQPGQPAPGDPLPIDPGTMPQLGAPEAPQVTYAPSPLQQNIDRDQQRLQKVDWAQKNPWGTANNHPGTLGKIAHVLSVAGNIAGDIVAPNVMANIPGTQLNRQVEAGGLTHRLNEETEEQSQNQGRDATTQATQLANAAEPQATADRHALSGAQAANLQSETDTRNNPQPNLTNAYAHAVDAAIKAGRDPHSDPVVQQLSDAIVSLQPGQNKPDAAPKTIDVVPPGSKNPHTMGWDAKTGKFDIDEGEHYEKPTTVNVNAGLGALDRETKQFGGSHQKAAEQATGQLEKIADARSMINGNAEAQGLGIPKVLTALVGGQGTGVRITQAELTSIAHARGLSGDVEGTLNKLAGKGALSHAQQQQLTQILDDVKSRIQQKMQIHSDALDSINGASSREEIIKADKDARKKISDLETSGTTAAAPSGGGAHYKYIPGKGLVAQ